MEYHSVIEHHFPGALAAADFVNSAHAQLGAFGFSAANSITCVGTCRDEVCRPFAELVEQKFGEAFNFSSLGGLIFAGRTGFVAATQHAPTVYGRERYIFFSLPHIGISAAGEIGKLTRPGQTALSPTCGALAAFRQELLDGNPSFRLDPDDVEQSLLKQRLAPELTWGASPSLVELTKLTRRAAVADLEHMLSLTINTAACDYAVLSGVQIHLPDAEYVWPAESYVWVAGQREEIGGW